MDRLFEPNSTDLCCLCGSAENLTGEHKIKASAIRKLFSSGPMLIGAFDGLAAPRIAQSAKSKAFHFGAPVCVECNTTRTQASDIAFTQFDELALARLEAGADPGDNFKDQRYAVGCVRYLNLFRYFAKILACQIADAQGPRMLALTEFAISKQNFNPVHLEMWPDPEYSAMRKEIGLEQFAAHGGLEVIFFPQADLSSCLRSSITHRALRYTFSVKFQQKMASALKAHYPIFHERCALAYRQFIAAHADDQSTT